MRLKQKDWSSLTFLYECNDWLQSPNRVSLAVKKRSMCTLREFEVHRGVGRQRYTKSSVHTHINKLPALSHCHYLTDVGEVIAESTQCTPDDSPSSSGWSLLHGLQGALHRGH